MSLHKYLDNRYADTVVLTFSQIEGFPRLRAPRVGAPRASVVGGRWRGRHPVGPGSLVD